MNADSIIGTRVRMAHGSGTGASQDASVSPYTRLFSGVPISAVVKEAFFLDAIIDSFWLALPSCLTW